MPSRRRRPSSGSSGQATASFSRTATGRRSARSSSAQSWRQPHAYRLPLDCCVASTQGEVGYVLQYAMWQMMQAEGLNIPVVSLITQVLVDSRDPAFRHPTKPIGPS